MNESIEGGVIFHPKGESPMKKSRHITEQIIRILRERGGVAGAKRSVIFQVDWWESIPINYYSAVKKKVHQAAYITAGCLKKEATR